jgi:hypothetical protein
MNLASVCLSRTPGPGRMRVDVGSILDRALPELRNDRPGPAGREHSEPVEQLLLRLGDQLHAGDGIEPDERSLLLG